MTTARLSQSTAACFVAVLLAALSAQAVFQIADPDLWGRLASPALWFGTGHFPYQDPLSFTAGGAEWVDHEWLSGLVFFGVLRTFGEAGLVLFKDLLLAGCLATIFWLHRRVYRVPPALALVGLLATLPIYTHGFRATVRCQVFTFLFFLLFVAVLEAVRLERVRTRWLALLICAGVLWANLHAGFAVGVLITLGYGAGAILARRSLRAGLPFAGCAAAIMAGCTLVNPYGPRYLAFLFHAWTFDRSDIREWAPLWPPQAEHAGIWFLLVAVAGLIVMRVTWWRRAGDVRTLGGPLAALVLVLAMALRALRFQTFLALGAVALLPLLLPRPVAARRLTRVLSVVAACLGGITLLSPASHPLTAPMLPAIFPIDAIARLRAIGARGNLVTPFVAGELAAWALYPRMRVAVDGRFEEVYSLWHVRLWLEFYRTDETNVQIAPWPRRRGADWLIAPHEPAGVEKSLRASPEWTLVQSDPDFTLWRARGPGGEAFADASPRAELPTIADFFRADDLKRFEGH